MYDYYTFVKRNFMKHFFVVLFCFACLISCTTYRKVEKNTYYMWEDKIVTKKQYDSLLDRHTYEFNINYFAKMDSIKMADTVSKK